MSLHANPLLYLNMGGEMLYVLRQRLKAQKIAINKSVQVLDEVSTNLINPQIVTRIFQQSGPIDLNSIRSILENALLSSIMRLDETSMKKLFDLIIMMVKYQIEMATGPRELVLITLNHVDSMRDMPVNSSDGHQSLVLIHQMILQLYGNLTYEEMWQVRKACLINLDIYKVRISILLRLSLQREDGSLVAPKNRSYDERYDERSEDLWNLKIVENSCEGCNIGSLKLIGDRVTFLGCNIYLPSYGTNEKIEKKFVNGKNGRKLRLSKEGSDSRAELGMLAVQLGNSDDIPSNSESSSKAQFRPFTLQLFTDNSSEIIQTGESISEQDVNCTKINLDDNRESTKADKPNSNNIYKAQLDNIYSDLIVDEDVASDVARKIELLDLMDQLE